MTAAKVVMLLYTFFFTLFPSLALAAVNPNEDLAQVRVCQAGYDYRITITAAFKALEVVPHRVCDLYPASYIGLMCGRDSSTVTSIQSPLSCNNKDLSKNRDVQNCKYTPNPKGAVVQRFGTDPKKWPEGTTCAISDYRLAPDWKCHVIIVNTSEGTCDMQKLVPVGEKISVDSSTSGNLPASATQRDTMTTPVFRAVPPTTLTTASKDASGIGRAFDNSLTPAQTPSPAPANDPEARAGRSPSGEAPPEAKPTPRNVGDAVRLPATPSGTGDCTAAAFAVYPQTPCDTRTSKPATSRAEASTFNRIPTAAPRRYACVGIFECTGQGIGDFFRRLFGQ